MSEYEGLSTISMIKERPEPHPLRVNVDVESYRPDSVPNRLVKEKRIKTREGPAIQRDGIIFIPNYEADALSQTTGHYKGVHVFRTRSLVLESGNELARLNTEATFGMKQLKEALDAGRGVSFGNVSIDNSNIQLIFKTIETLPLHNSILQTPRDAVKRYPLPRT